MGSVRNFILRIHYIALFVFFLYHILSIKHSSIVIVYLIFVFLSN